jgi:uncharacterized protein (TIGR03437 family)
MCIFKLNPLGNLIGQFCFGDSGGNSGSVAIGPDGNPVLVGITYSSASLQLISPLIPKASSEAGYVIKFKSDLTGIIFSTLVGGTMPGSIGSGTTISALTIDQTGKIYVAGWTLDSDFPITAGAYETSPPTGAIPSFITAISSAGDQILWSTLLGGPKSPCTKCNPGSINVSGLTVDTTGAVVIAGSATGEQIPVTPGVVGPTCLCATNSNSPVAYTPAAFVAKLSSGGSQLTWATYVNYVSVAALALDANDNVIIGGQAYSGFTTTSGALQTAYPGGPQIQHPSYNTAAGFLVKIDSSATRYLFATYLGGNNYDNGLNGVTAVALDAQGIVWVTGGSLPSELPVPGSVPMLGTNYIVGMKSDGSGVTVALTAPEGGAGAGIGISPQGPVGVGNSGSTLIPAPALPAFVGIANAAGLTANGSVAPNELISLYGQGLGPSTAASGAVVNGILTTSLGGVQVQFDGVSAPMTYAGPNQINAIVPSRVSGQSSTTMNIVTPAGQISGIVLRVTPSTPEVFTYQPGNIAYCVNQDGTLNSRTNPAPPGAIISVWASGGGLSGNPEADGAITGDSVFPLQLAVLVGNGTPGVISIAPVIPPIPLPLVLYSGDAPDLVKGAIQVNFQIPLQAGSAASVDAVDFYLQIGSAHSDPFAVYVQ